MDSYALPASAVHSHHGHGHGHVHAHSHSHSLSPSRQAQYSSANTANTPRSLKHELSSGSLHLHTHSEPHLDHNHSHSHSSHSQSRERSSYLPTPSDSDSVPSLRGSFEKHKHEIPPSLGSHGVYKPPSNDVHTHSHDDDGHGHDHDHHGHHHDHSSTGATVEKRSRFTNLLLPWVHQWPLLHTILANKDSRRIFYFMSLNFAFMIVQAFYGFLTDSLGLLSDSIHMFFDCLALAVGLFAAVASKWPPSERFPYGFGMIESLSGFGNGVFLMLISIEILIEAMERLAEGRETKRLTELFVVSSLGLAVNLVGMACFGHHGHAGHDHGGHSHGHSHEHSHTESHSHSHDDGHKCDHDHNHDHANHAPLLKDTPPASAHHHTHSHDNENMRGIFLHVLADTMGSAAVIVSTLLIHFVGWSGWDPLASCVIAILIFLSSIPLVSSCAKKLLLTVPDDVEYNLRNTLSGVSDLRGVASYTVPRFWMGDKNTQSESEQILGVMHVVATRGSDLDDVRERTRDFLSSKGMDVVVQVEAEGEDCWCGSSSVKSPSRYS